MDKDRDIESLLSNARDVNEIVEALAGGADYMILYLDGNDWRMRYKANVLEILGLMPFVQMQLTEAQLDD